MKKSLILLMLSCSLLGIADAGYITWQKFHGLIPRCTTGFKCEEVLTSRWANIGPVPLSVLGIVFYVTFLVLMFLIGLEKTEFTFGSRKISLHFLALIWGIFGALFSLYLLTIMGLILNAWCLYCLLSAINCLALFTLSTTSYKLHTKASLV